MINFVVIDWNREISPGADNPFCQIMPMLTTIWGASTNGKINHIPIICIKFGIYEMCLDILVYLPI